MKVFYLTRLFSGLESSFLEKKWSPTGVPTIYRIIEEIDRKHKVKFIFTAKDSGTGYFSNWKHEVDQSFFIEGLHHEINILSGINVFPKWFGRRIRMILREIRQAIYIVVYIYKFDPNIVYFDHANVIVAGILSRMMKRTSFVFRVMGVDQFMRDSVMGSSVIHKIYKWSYKSPYNLVICTQDGSGVEMWLKESINHTTPVKVLLNGTDSIVLDDKLDNRLAKLPNDKIIILFVGKLEIYKGCYEFINSIELLRKESCGKFHALIIGTGSEQQKLHAVVENSDIGEYVTFIESLSHRQILAAHHLCDIYVSLNYFGNLSNANLEAIQSDDCMIIPEYQPNLGIDIITNDLLGDAVVNVPIKQPAELARAILSLIMCKDKRLQLSCSVHKIKQKFLWTWDERVQAEIELLEMMGEF